MRTGQNLYKRKDGLWEARVPLGIRANGCRYFKCFYGKTYQEARNRKQDYEKKMSKKRVYGKKFFFSMHSLLFFIALYKDLIAHQYCVCHTSHAGSQLFSYLHPEYTIPRSYLLVIHEGSDFSSVPFHISGIVPAWFPNL